MSVIPWTLSERNLPLKSTRNANSIENDWKSREIGGLDDSGADLATFRRTVSLAARATRVAINDTTEARTIL